MWVGKYGSDWEVTLFTQDRDERQSADYCLFLLVSVVFLGGCGIVLFLCFLVFFPRFIFVCFVMIINYHWLSAAPPPPPEEG